jgi:hypothetical protein
MKLFYKLRSAWEEAKLHTRVLAAACAAPWAGEITTTGRVYATKIASDGTREDLGLVSTKVVTTAAVNYIVDALQANTTDVSLFRFHGSGTGTTAEAIGQTALVTETGSRVSGTQTEGASANIYRTVATIAYGSTLAITEHGIFSASSGGTLLDRSLFAAINVVSGDSIQFTYELTVPAGS